MQVMSWGLLLLLLLLPTLGLWRLQVLLGLVQALGLTMMLLGLHARTAALHQALLLLHPLLRSPPATVLQHLLLLQL